VATNPVHHDAREHAPTRELVDHPEVPVRRAAALLATTALLLAACGGQDAATPPQTPVVPAPSATAQQHAPEQDGPEQDGGESPQEPEPSPDPAELRVALEPVADGLVAPVQAFVLDGRELVVQQDGRVVELDGGATWLDLSDRVDFGGERGLLGAAVHPDGTHLVVHFSAASDGRTVLGSLPLQDGRPEPGGLVTLLEVDQPASNHNGGSVLFGPDGLLYLALGDGGGAGDRFGNGQDPSTLLGTVLRLDLTDPTSLAVPDDNPFVDGGGAREVWLHGLRNPYRVAIGDGQLYVADVGQDGVEEITVVPLDGQGRNLGWPVLEGDRCFAVSDCDPSDFEAPDVTYTHADTGGCSVITGLVYAGEALPALGGHLLYGDLCGGFLRTVRAEDGTAVDQYDLSDQVGPVPQLLSVSPDRDGEPLLLFADGRIERLVPAG